jgi:hypothetical protein
MPGGTVRSVVLCALAANALAFNLNAAAVQGVKTPIISAVAPCCKLELQQAGAQARGPQRLLASKARAHAAAACFSLLPLATAAEEVTAFKKSGMADALGSLELGVLILGLAAPAYVIYQQKSGGAPDPNTPEVFAPSVSLHACQ